jgi:hypothetical protein
MISSWTRAHWKSRSDRIPIRKIKKTGAYAPVLLFPVTLSRTYSDIDESEIVFPILIGYS